MKTIPVNYIDTTKYIVKIWPDDYTDSPTEWGNYTIVQFVDKDWSTYDNIENYCTENGKLLPSMQAKIKAGVAFSFTYYRYSNTDGGFYKYPSNETNPDNIDGFIIFEREYIKNTTYEERKQYATEDLQTYTEWANGEVYGVTVETSAGEVVDTCGGFIGDYAVKQYIADTIPYAINKNVTIIGEYADGGTYDTYITYDKCINNTLDTYA